jgi:threonine dehydratase
VQDRIASAGVAVRLVAEADIRAGMRALFRQHALVVEPSSAVALAFVRAQAQELEGPACVILTGGNITRADFDRLIDVDSPCG